MSQINIHMPKGRTVVLLIAALMLIPAGFKLAREGNLDAYLVRKKVVYTWKVLTPADVQSGATIPPNTHVVFHLPDTFESISRRVLLGHKGETTRYWGYCIPQNAPTEITDTRTGFPGLLFLSEKERAIRALEAEEAAATYTPGGRLPTAEELQEKEEAGRGAIRHQVELFKPNTLCYIMSEAPLPIGLDQDGDRLNDRLEKGIGTDITVPDTDGDGIIDGIEYLTNTNPRVRDTDNDGIIDGIEDANWNGREDPGETSPRVRDTDRDGLCDGMCREKLQKQDYYMGEDKNLNGIVDEGESDPRKYSTKDNGISDQVPYIQCLAAGRTTCP